jgi:hypothetical protein
LGVVDVLGTCCNSGTYEKATNTGGSNGATMRFPMEAKDGANAGLGKARDLLEPIKAKYPSRFRATAHTGGAFRARSCLGRASRHACPLLPACGPFGQP